MAILNLTDLRNQVNTDIKTNGVRAITGNIMNTQLIDMIDSIESDYDGITGGLDTRLTNIESAALLILQDPLTGWDASVGTFPGGATGNAGFYWNVSVAGIVDGITFEVGDSILQLVNNASTTVYSGNWNKEDNIDAVISVAGKVGAITLVASDITDFDAEVANNTAVGLNTSKLTNVSTNLSHLADTTQISVNSSDGTNTTLIGATSLLAGVLTSAKFDEVVANTLKVSDIDHNATHTSEVTGATALTVAPLAVSNKTLVTAAGAMELLVNDAGTLKKVVASDFLAGVSDGDKGDISVTASGATWTVDDEVVTFAKMQHIATNKILGRGTAGTGDVEELTISGDLQILLGVLGLNKTPLYISDVTTVNLLDDLANWTSGNYTGLLITGTFQGQNHYNSTYKFECVLDNVWIRILRS